MSIWGCVSKCLNQMMDYKEDNLAYQTTKEDVATLLENFSDYVNPQKEFDPWFRVSEINQQFAWDDVPEDTLIKWLEEMLDEGLVAVRTDGEGETEYRWLS